MAISISVLILVIGLISLFTLPVEQYPDIAPPTVYVSANYTGADAEAVLNSVIMPLEESINGVENMMYISFYRHQCRFCHHTSLFQAGHGPRHGCGERTEPRIQGAGTAARRSDENRCDYPEAADQLPANRRFGEHRRALRPDVPCQLPRHQRDSANQTYRRCG